MSQVKEFKERIGQSAEGIIASGLGLVKKNGKYKCPNGLAHKNGDKNPSMAWDRKALNFHCFGCDYTVDIYSYYREHLGMEHKDIMEKHSIESGYKQSSGKEQEEPKVNFAKQLKPLTDECKKYLKTRWLTDETLKHFGIMSFENNIAIPYMDNSGITGVKHRKPIKKPPKPKYLSISGSQFGLFNRLNADTSIPLVIVEGEIDCMIVYQAGYKNVVSVGTGANALNKLISQEKNFLNQFPYLIVFSDNDEAGDNMDEKMLKEFPEKVKLVDKKLCTQNDINLEYHFNGAEKIMQIIDSAKLKIEGLRNLDEEPYKGLSVLDGKFIPTGIESIDHALNDLAPRLTTLITGRSNGGKSTVVNQLIANAIDKGNKVLLINGEGFPETIINNLYKIVIGRNEEYYQYKQINKRKFKEPKPHVLEALKKWHKGKLTIFNKGDSKLKKTNQLLAVVKQEIRQNKYNLVVIDNLMSVLSVEKASEKNEAQADFMQECCNLAQNENAHITLVLHPNKTLSKDSDMDFEQISGNSDLYNKADNIIAVKREFDEDVLAQGIHGQVSVLKNRVFGDLIKVNTYYDDATSTLLERKDDGSCIAYAFNWLKYLEGTQEAFKGFEEIDDPNIPW